MTQMQPAAVEQISAQKKEIIELYGEWTAHNIYLGNGIYTISDRLRGDDVLARRVLQIVSDVVDRPLNTSRVLDLGCLEGLYAIEFARQGARAVGVEIREANIAKARFVKETLALDNLELVQDDVRNLSAAKYGLFDAVLCLGILYHLDAPDVFDFVHRMAEVCRRCLVIDTHVSNLKEVSFTHATNEYWGKIFSEHQPNSTPEEREKQLWASIDNTNSFWLTRSSLCNLLAHAGFTSVFECHNPPFQHGADRVTLLAIKGQSQKVISSPALSVLPPGDWNDSIPELPVEYVSWGRRFARKLPAPIKSVIKKAIR